MNNEEHEEKTDNSWPRPPGRSQMEGGIRAKESADLSEGHSKDEAAAES